MKSVKSFRVKLDGNQGKLKYIEQTLDTIKDLSWCIFELKKQFEIHWWFNQKKLYHQCRKMFPELNSKIFQNFISLYFPKKGRKLPKKPISPSIFLDQAFQVNYSNKTTYTNYWLKFHKKFFPLFGRNILKKIDFSKVKLVQIFRKNGQLYCKLTQVKELPKIEAKSSTSIVGCDINFKRIVISNNDFFIMKKLAHRKMEHKKNNQRKRNLTNYSKDYIHKMTTQISKNLHEKGVDVLVLEDLRSLRKSASKKLGTSKGRMLNYIINSMPYGMFQSFLKYKCLDLGIQVETINPAYTSKTCSRCGSLNTSRPKQETFICLNCGFKLNADLNGSRNIEKFYRSLNGLPVNLAQIRT